MIQGLIMYVILKNSRKYQAEFYETNMKCQLRVRILFFFLIKTNSFRIILMLKLLLR